MTLTGLRKLVICFNFEDSNFLLVIDLDEFGFVEIFSGTRIPHSSTLHVVFEINFRCVQVQC